MTEQYDALQRFDPWGTLGLALGLLALGVALEVILRLAGRWAISRNRHGLGLILGALHWQPLFWCVLFAAAFLLANLSDVSTARQRGLEILGGLLLISLTIVAVRILTGWIKMLTARRPSASVSVLGYLINGVAIIIVLTVVLYVLNMPVPLLVVTLFGSTFGLSLAFREPLANLFAGVALTASSRVNPGDYVRLASGEEGHVKDIEWDITTIQQQRNSLLVVPNSLMAKAELINFHHPEPEISVQVPVGVSYDSDLEQVERVTIDVAGSVMREVSGGVPAYRPYIRYKAFGDSDIRFTVHMRAQEFAGQNLIKHELIKRLSHRYEEEGIVMPFPTVALHTPPGEVLTVVEGDPLSSPAPAKTPQPSNGPQAMTTEEG